MGGGHQPQEAVEQGQVDLLVHLGVLRLDADDALAVGRVPHVRQVVDAEAPLVDEEGRRLRVGRLDPVGQQVSLVALIPQVLVEVGVGDLLERLHVVDRLPTCICAAVRQGVPRV